MASTAPNVDQALSKPANRFIGVHWHVTVEEVNHYCMEGEIINVSINGALLECTEKICENSKIKLIIDADMDDGQHKLQCLALVKKQLCKNNKHFISLKFLSMPEADYGALQHFALHH